MRNTSNWKSAAELPDNEEDIPKRKKVFAATIIFPGEPGEREPSARLDDGREFPMGWNMGEEIPVGTKGTAQYLTTPTMGLWKFKITPDGI